MENEADVFYRQLPKVELHAHLNGSVSSHTIEKLIDRKPHLNIEHNMTAIGKGQRRTLDECVYRVMSVVDLTFNTRPVGGGRHQTNGSEDFIRNFISFNMHNQRRVVSVFSEKQMICVHADNG